MNSNDREAKEGSATQPTRAKKPYAAPKLQVFGDIRALTNSNATGSTADGMTGSGMNMSFP